MIERLDGDAQTAPVVESIEDVSESALDELSNGKGKDE